MKTTERKALRPAVRLMIAASNGYDCVLCGHRLGAQFHIDHRVALCNGGEDGLDNLQAICANCHADKTAVDNQIYWDKQEELRSGLSRFFNPFAYQGPNGPRSNRAFARL
jgi:5-methylcytosine-specific restriction endonuclease McrA